MTADLPVLACTEHEHATVRDVARCVIPGPVRVTGAADAAESIVVIAWCARPVVVELYGAPDTADARRAYLDTTCRQRRGRGRCTRHSVRLITTTEEAPR